MTILSRPLFRQAGGPIQAPAPMPAAMAAQQMPPRPAPGPRPAAQGSPPPQAQAEGVRRFAERQTRPVGQQIAQQTMQSIDAAQDPESLINALRGNQKPIEARYAELAQFVGEQDAQSTPESVLALVQPTLMMTQSGAVDSGIGELMQRLVGDITMEGSAGPTPMGQGIGELMGAGQGAGPEPAGNFSAGPEIPGFQEGGEASRGRVDPELYERIYGQLRGMERTDVGSEVDEARKVAQAQALFDIAQGGLALAAGAPAGGSFAQQAAAAFAPVAGSLGKRGAEFFATERALKKEARAEDIALRKLAADMARSQDRAASMFEVRGPDGAILATGNVNDSRERAALDQVRRRTPGAMMYRVEGAPQPRQLSMTERNAVVLGNPAIAHAWARGELSPEDAARVEQILTSEVANVRPESVVDENGVWQGRILPLAGIWQDAIQEARRRGRNIPRSLYEGVAFPAAAAPATAAPATAAPATAAPATAAPATAAPATAAPATAAPATAAPATAAPATPGAAAPATARLGEEAWFRVQDAYGLRSNFQGFLNGILGTLEANSINPDVSQARKDAQNLRELTSNVLLRANYEGQRADKLRQDILSLVPDPGAGSIFGGTSGAGSTIQAVVRRLNNEIYLVRAGLEATSAEETRTRTPLINRDRIVKEKMVLAELENLRNIWSGILSTMPAAPSVANPARRARDNFLTRRQSSQETPGESP